MQNESWQKLVLRSQPDPYWLSSKSPAVDVVLSTRLRWMRNLHGTRFPSRATVQELASVADVASAAVRALQPEVALVKGLTQAERDYYVGARLVSADFPWTLPHRMLAVDAGLRLGLMVNEEDHFRLQSISPGWTPAEAEQNGASLLGELGKNARFATFGEGGFIAASPPNGGRGIRLSAMTHLIGLAATGKLNSVAAALRAQGIAVRGLFGETSRAVGAFAQVSVLNGNIQDLAGAVTYLIDAERDARAQFGEAAMRERVEKASKLATGSRLLSLANALRVLAWWRWQALVADNDPRIVDRALASLEIRDAATDEDASVSRAAILRSVAEIISQTDKWG